MSKMNSVGQTREAPGCVPSSSCVVFSEQVASPLLYTLRATTAPSAAASREGRGRAANEEPPDCVARLGCHGLAWDAVEENGGNSGHKGNGGEASSQRDRECREPRRSSMAGVLV